MGFSNLVGLICGLRKRGPNCSIPSMGCPRLDFFIKGVNRLASVAFAPDAPFLAAGTMVEAVDLSFSLSVNLDIFKLDFQSDDRDLPIVGSSPSPERFNRLSWGEEKVQTKAFSPKIIPNSSFCLFESKWAEGIPWSSLPQSLRRASEQFLSKLREETSLNLESAKARVGGFVSGVQNMVKKREAELSELVFVFFQLD
ncbi:hypothetical protein F0562_012115 [Nyssa sinensis]|uniref:Uncharacterized protein n=1 Tax=Nyssa sinensis TaxID=561372 RepID=A0A5J4ZVJ6_9ASTE|nr:hypothetical protein F0562_012115 [Nyssa sinensis]